MFLYGSSRLDVYRPKAQPAQAATAGTFTRCLQQKSYELTDHLGNVRVVIGDYRDRSTTSVIRVALRSYAEYYAFGLEMPGMNYKGSDAYRYAYNGKEQDPEFQNNYDYGFRIYNPGIAKFLSVDPLTRNFPWWTPYQFAGNTPIQAIDLDGLEIFLPRALPYPIELILTIPRVPPMPTIPGEVILPPVVPNLPPGVTVEQPQGPSVTKSTEFDWNAIDPTDTSTWPEAPPLEGQGTLREGDPSNAKPRKLGQKRWFDEKGREYRPHKPDKYHPKGHWDVKDGPDGPWENYTPDGVKIPEGKIWGDNWEPPATIINGVYTLPEVIISAPRNEVPMPTQNRNFFQKAWGSIKDWYQQDLKRRQTDEIPDHLKA